MERILMTPEGKKVKVNIKDDMCLYDAPHNPPNTGTRYTRGIDLFAHKARSGKMYFYVYHWSMWQGDEHYYELISEERAREFLLEKAGITGQGSMDQSDVEKIEEIFPGIFEEDA